MTITTTTAPTRTPEAASRTSVRVTRGPSGTRARVHLEATGPAQRPLIRPVLVASDPASARVCLVPEGALLLSGDQIGIELEVGAGMRLEIIEPGGTVAYGMDGGSATWRVEAAVQDGGSLVWAGEPFVVCAGARVERSTGLRLGQGSWAALRETVVLGRHGEAPGRLIQTVQVVADDGALLHESLQVGPDSSRLLLGGATAIGSVLVAGRRLSPDLEVPPGHVRFDAEGEVTVVRSLGTTAHTSISGAVWQAASR